MAVLFLGSHTAAGQQPVQTPPSTCVRNCGDSTTSGPSRTAPRARGAAVSRDFLLAEGVAYFNKRDWNNAVHSFEAALERAPNDAEVLGWLSRARAARTSPEFVGAMAPDQRAGTPFAIAAIREIRGTATLVTGEGRRLSGQNIALVPIDRRAHLFTGPGSTLVAELADGTTFTMLENADIQFEESVYDPDTSLQKVTISLIKGAFRWVTGKSRRLYRPHIATSVIGIGTRGTDFEVVLAETDRGYVRVYDGLVEYRENGGTLWKLLRPGQTLRFERTGVTGIE